jgi:hypothetical protein
MAFQIKNTFLKRIEVNENHENTGEGPNHQSFIPNYIRKSEQHFTAHHFFNAHK